MSNLGKEGQSLEELPVRLAENVQDMAKDLSHRQLLRAPISSTWQQRPQIWQHWNMERMNDFILSYVHIKVGILQVSALTDWFRSWLRAFLRQNSEVLRRIEAHVFAELLRRAKRTTGIRSKKRGEGKVSPPVYTMSKCFWRCQESSCVISRFIASWPDWLWWVPIFSSLNLVQGVAWPHCQAVTRLVAHRGSFNPWVAGWGNMPKDTHEWDVVWSKLNLQASISFSEPLALTLCAVPLKLGPM